MTIYVNRMILWGTDFQPESLWITAVSVSRADFDLLLQCSVHLVHAICVLKIMPFSGLTLCPLIISSCVIF